MKTCIKCNVSKPQDGFHKQKSAKDGLSSSCKMCKAAYYAENKERIKIVEIKYRSENAEKMKEKSAKYYADNMLRVKQYHVRYAIEKREQLRGKGAEYRLKNKEKVLAKKRNYRAARKNSEGHHGASDIKSIFFKQGGMCANCRNALEVSGANRYHVDHITPLARGGSNWPSNLQCLCPSCNLRKHAKDPIAWAQENGRLL